MPQLNRKDRRIISRPLPSYTLRRPHHYTIYTGDPRNRHLLRSVLPDHRLPSQRHQRPADPSGRCFGLVDRVTAAVGAVGALAGGTGEGCGGVESEECEGDSEMV